MAAIVRNLGTSVLPSPVGGLRRVLHQVTRVLGGASGGVPRGPLVSATFQQRGMTQLAGSSRRR